MPAQSAMQSKPIQALFAALLDKADTVKRSGDIPSTAPVEQGFKLLE